MSQTPGDSDDSSEQGTVDFYTDGYALALEYTWDRTLTYANYDVCIGVPDLYLSCLELTKQDTSNDDSSYDYSSVYWYYTSGETGLADGDTSLPANSEVSSTIPGI